MINLHTQFTAMNRVLSHMCAGYRVDINALGEDGSDGYTMQTETRSGDYIEAHGPTIPETAEILARKL